MEMFIIVIFAVFVVMGLAWSFYAAKKRREAAKKRREAAQALADKLGLRFSSAKDHSLASRYTFLDKLRQGSNRYAQNVLSGTFQGHSVTAFDYHYETYSSDSKGRRQTHHHYFSFFILTLDKFFPELTLGKEGLFSKIAQAVGFDDIDFESHEFSRKFTVRSKDKKFAYDFFNAQMIDYLMDYPNLNIEVDQNALALGFNRRLKIEEVEPHLNQLVKIRSLMPDYLFTKEN